MRSFGDNVARRAGREIGHICEHRRRWEQGFRGTANTCELPINVVKVSE